MFPPDFQTETLLKLLLAESEDGVLAYDSDLVIRTWNPVMERFSGLAANEVLDRSLVEVVPFIQDVGELRDIRRALEGETVASGRRPLFVASTGQTGFFQSKHFPLRDTSGRIIGGMGLVRFFDSAAAAPEGAWSLEAIRLLQLQSIIRSLSKAVTPADVGEVILGETMKYFRSSRGVITRVPEEGDLAEVLISSGRPEEGAGTWCTLPLSRAMPTTVAIRTQQSVFHSTQEALLESYPEARAWVLGNGLHAFCAVPLVIENRVVGALGLGFDQARAFTKEERGFLETLVGPCAQAFERSHAFEREKKARQTAEAANQAKDRFIANLSHEIRTPLCSVINFAEFLTAEHLEADKREKFIEGVRRNGRTLVRLIDDILDISRIESGRLKINYEALSVAMMLEEIELIFRESAEEKRIGLTTRMAPELPSKIHSDPIRLRQILVNLVGNAVKFTVQGEVHVEARLVPRSEGRAEQVEFLITDSGIGIHPEDQIKIFDPFYQVDNSLTREYPGTGLGLALSRRLAHALDGSVSLEKTKYGQGSVFALRIALNPVGLSQDHVIQVSAGSAEAEADSAKWPRAWSILVVEDQPDIRDVVREALLRVGASVTIAENGQAALDLCESGSYDVVLMDLQMPVMDGYTALEHLKRRGFSKPIVAFTAHALDEDVKRIQAAGFSGHLTKPFELSKLLPALGRLSSSRLADSPSS